MMVISISISTPKKYEAEKFFGRTFHHSERTFTSRASAAPPRVVGPSHREKNAPLRTAPSSTAPFSAPRRHAFPSSMPSPPTRNPAACARALSCLPLHRAAPPPAPRTAATSSTICLSHRKTSSVGDPAPAGEGAVVAGSLMPVILCPPNLPSRPLVPFLSLAESPPSDLPSTDPPRAAPRASSRWQIDTRLSRLTSMAAPPWPPPDPSAPGRADSCRTHPRPRVGALPFLGSGCDSRAQP
jgi:hypothetical protein